MPTTAVKNDAISLLMGDHRVAEALFKEYEKIHEDASETEKSQLALKICNALTCHAQLEEEIFYPAVRKGIEETDLVNEATVEHASAKDLIAQIKTMAPSDELYDAKVKVFGEYINHHVEEEETEMFPKVKKSDLDLEELGAEIETRKGPLLVSLGVDPEEMEELTKKAVRNAARRTASKAK